VRLSERDVWRGNIDAGYAIRRSAFGQG
jgi:hypothetical protein